MKPNFFGLLHLDKRERSAVNLANSDFSEQMLLYANAAIVLSNSLRSQGINFTLLTNDLAAIQEYVPLNRGPLQIAEIPCTTDVPSGIKFYSAHFKIDAMRYIAKLCKGYSILSDLDAVCINEYPQSLRNIVQSATPIYYDISEQVIPVFGHAKIIQDLKTIHGISGEGRWIGGEFIGGTSPFFSALLAKIDAVYGNYISNVAQLHHVGDEAVTSAAAELLRRSGVYIADAGTIGIVARYWNRDVLHPQRPLRSYLRDCFLLHLPADKKFLSDLAEKPVTTASQYKDLYLRHWKSPAQASNRAARRSLSWLKGHA